MTDSVASKKQSLTGVWHGLYTYAGGLSVSFVATLIENGSWISGSTHEPCVLGDCPSSTLHASLAGRRRAATVSFTKTYDRAGGSYSAPVAYEGTVNEDATEIAGRWSIRPSWSGTFLMIREAGKAAEIEREAFERA